MLLFVITLVLGLVLDLVLTLVLGLALGFVLDLVLSLGLDFMLGFMMHKFVRLLFFMFWMGLLLFLMVISFFCLLSLGRVVVRNVNSLLDGMLTLNLGCLNFLVNFLFYFSCSRLSLFLLSGPLNFWFSFLLFFLFSFVLWLLVSAGPLVVLVVKLLVVEILLRHVPNAGPIFEEVLLLATQLDEKSPAEDLVVEAVPDEVNRVYSHIEHDLEGARVVVLDLEELVFREGLLHILLSGIEAAFDQVQGHMLDVFVELSDLLDNLLPLGVAEFLLLVLVVVHVEQSIINHQIQSIYIIQILLGSQHSLFYSLSKAYEAVRAEAGIFRFCQVLSQSLSCLDWCRLELFLWKRTNQIKRSTYFGRISVA